MGDRFSRVPYSGINSNADHSITVVGRRISLSQKVLYTVVFIIALCIVIFLLPSGQREVRQMMLWEDYGYNATYPLTKPVRTSQGIQYRIGIVADPDERSKVEGESNTWQSYFKVGYLILSHDRRRVQVVWDKEIELKTHLSEGGRGAELSELVVFNGKLLTVDDRSGVVYEIIGNTLVPWVVLPDGDGRTPKGFKAEWMTVKDKVLYVGGLGKVWTTTTGEVVNDNPQHVKIISAVGHVLHQNWADYYNAMMHTVGIYRPGYVIHESCNWSPYYSKWFFLPRRASHEKYDDQADEKRATNLMLIADSAFTSIKSRKIGDVNPTHGFSSFKFIPQTKDTLFVALKTEEDQGRIASYIMVFTTSGELLMDEQKIGDIKFEGIEFI